MEVKKKGKQEQSSDGTKISESKMIHLKTINEMKHIKNKLSKCIK